MVSEEIGLEVNNDKK